VRRWVSGEIELVVSAALLEELLDVLMRRKLRKYVSAGDAVAFVELLRLTATLKPDPEVEPGLTPDPKDDYLVALARATGAACIVSGDAHLTGLADPRPPVFTPRELLERLR
jgi:putative PIN family toxin of toxin-antitoxin system